MSTADEIREAEQANAADLFHGFLYSVVAAVENIEKDPGKAAAGTEDGALADQIATVQDLRYRLGMVERDLTTELGRRLGRTTGELSDGRQFKLERSADRKEWDHEDWKRDVRRALVDQTLDNLAVSREAVVVDPTTGMETEQTLALIIQSAIINAQVVHGAQAPKSTELKKLGLFATDYCTSTPGGWRFSAVKPTAPTTEKETSADG